MPKNLTEAEKEIIECLFRLHADNGNAERFTRRMLVLISYEANMTLQDCCEALEALRLVKRGTWQWFEDNGGITPKQTVVALSKNLRPEVQAFAQLMEQQLQANDHKPGWQNDSMLCLLVRLMEEARELYVAIGRFDARAICREAADVANFAMMISDNAGRAAVEAMGGDDA